MRGMWIAWLAATAAVSWGAAGGARAGAPTPPQPERPAELVRLPAPAGLARLALPPPGHAAASAARRDDQAPPTAAAVVVLVPDALGEDGRSEPYVEALLWRGVAVLALGLDDDDDGDGAEGAHGGRSVAAARVAVDWLSRGARPEGGRVGLLGFGAGARAALEAAGGRPAVALYPDCRGLDLSEAGPALLLYGAAAEDAAACAELAAPPAVAVRPVPGAEHGWDVVGTLGTAAMLLPRPGGGAGVVRAVPNPDATLEAAGASAAHLAAVLGAPRSADR